MKKASSTKSKWLNRDVIIAMVFFIVLGLIWEYSVVLFDIKAYLLPSLSDIFREAWNLKSVLWQESLVTFREVILGFGLAVLMGIPIAAAIYFIPIARSTLYPLMIGLQSIPKIGLAPIIIVWFGYGISSKVIMALLFALFPIIISTLGGLAAVPKHLEEHFQALGASVWATFWKLRVPYALPSFMDGCKVAMPLAVIGAIVGEFVGSNDGLGNLILVATGSSNTALSFAALLAVTLLSLVLFFVLERIGKLVWWRAR